MGYPWLKTACQSSMLSKNAGAQPRALTLVNFTIEWLCVVVVMDKCWWCCCCCYCGLLLLLLLLHRQLLLSLPTNLV